jgi:Arc/MetJ family transcription regulator
MTSPAASSARPGRPEINTDLQKVAHLVHEEFGDRLDPHVIDECLAQVASRYADARVRSFVPLLVRRYVRDELQARLVDA